MAEDPIKLFASRAERYPQPDSADTALGIVRAVIAAVPIVGGPINEFLSLLLAPAVQRRRDDWSKELANGLDLIATKVEGLGVESLRQNDAFVSATIQATRIAIATHEREKREMLRNALLNIAVGKGPGEELEQIFLNDIEAFTCSHVKVLQFLWKGSSDLRPPISNYGQAIETVIPGLRGQNDLLQHIMNDLRNRGFSNLSGPSAGHPQNPSITNLGVDFLHFVEEPQAQQ